MSSGERIAAIDVGSNSIRLLVAEHDPASGLTIIDELRDQAQLARGVARHGRLEDASMERALEALRRMRDVCERRGVRRIEAVATSAVREAANGEDFVRRVREELALPLRVIDGHAEAALAYRSVAHHFALGDSRTLVADIGGGSLELIAAVDGLVEQTVSLPLGAVRLTEAFTRENWSPIKSLDRLRRHTRKALRKALRTREWTKARLIGSGGTFTALARMALARRGEAEPDTEHGVEVTTAEVEHLLEWLATKSPAQRRNVAGLNPERADIILAGLAVTAELLDLVSARGLTVSAFGLREGILLEMVGTPAERRRDPMRLVREFAERCQSDRRHVEQVRVLALQLYDQLGTALECQEGERDLLEAAAILHDVGQVVSYRRHHRHSYDLIMHADRLPFGPRERRIVALASRYHRRRGPRRTDEGFADLPSRDRGAVRRISALLRVADGLDRGHMAVVETLRCVVTDDLIRITALPRYAGADLALECWGATRKADLLAKLAGRTVEICGVTRVELGASA